MENQKKEFDMTSGPVSNNSDLTDGLMDLSDLQNFASLDEEAETVAPELTEEEVDDLIVNAINTNEEEEEEESTQSLNNNTSTEEQEEEEEEQDDLDIDVTNKSEKQVYVNAIKTLWGDQSIVLEEDGEEVETALEDLDIDQDMFVDIVNSKIEDLKESLTKDKVSTENLTNFTKDLIDIESNGGNITEAINLYQQIQEPFTSIDLDTEEGQIQAIKLRLEAENKSEEDIEDLLYTYKSKNILEEKALKSKEQLDDFFAEKVKKQSLAAEEAKKERESNLKAYKKEIKSIIKEEFKLKDSLVSKLVDYSTGVDENKVYHINKRYSEVRQDPKEAAELALFLYDKEEYLRQKTREITNKEKKDTLRKLKVIKRSKNTKIETKTNNTKSSDFIDLNEL